MNLKSYLTLSKITTEDFGRSVQVSGVTIGRYIKGQRIPHPEVMRRIVETTQGAVRPNDFYPEVAA